MYGKYSKCKSRESSKSPDGSGSSDKPEETDDATAPSNEENLSVGEESESVKREEGAEHEEGVEREEGEEREGLEKRAGQKRGSAEKDSDGSGYSGTAANEEDNDGTTKDGGKIDSETDLEGGESGSGAADDESFVEDGTDEFDQNEVYEDDKLSDETEDGTGKKKRKLVKAVMEYDIKDMYPEINILIQKKKREWDFQDPDIIRALWLESKTLALSEWKVRNAKIKMGNPSIEVKETVTVTLRQEHLKNKAQLQQALQERDFEMTEASRDPPHFDSIQLATNLTTDMRYKYNRNNPPVPSHYIEHFEKFKKPPFKNNAIWDIHS